MVRLGQALLGAAIAALLVAPSASAVVFSPDRVIVEWAPGASPAERSAAREEADVDFATDLGDRRFQLVETEPGQTPREAIGELEADPGVVLAERDGYAVLDSVPNDPLFDQLWGLQNTGLGINGFAGALAGADIGASSAWDRTVGTSNTVVADLDSGYRFEHPDLADVVWTNPGETLDGVDNDGNGIVDDVHGADFVGPDGEAPVTDGDPTDDDLISGGHGVHTAGTIGAEGNNGIGITGVAQDVSLMPLRVCSRINGENDCLFSAAITAINYAGEKGARVANMSFGSTTFGTAIANAIAANPQTLFVISAGNEEQNNDLISRRPCTVDPLAEGKSAVDNVICVAATDQADKLAGFSNWGAKTVDLGAPGTQTLSTYARHSFVDEDFEVDDFAARWSASGPDGGFARTNEAPLTSYGMTDSPGAAPVAGSTRAETTVPVTMPPGIDNCVLEYDYTVSLSPGGSYGYEVRLDGVTESSAEAETAGHFTGHRAVGISEALSAGGALDLRFHYVAGPDPKASDGVWLDNIELRCTALVGEADGYAFLNGTSMSAPHVTGTAALLFSLKPSASVAEVRQGLLSSVDRLPSLSGKTVTGGRLDAAAAVDLFDAVPPPVPVLSATNPASPSNDNQPRLIGSAQPGTSIDVYANATCVGSPLASGTAAQLGAPGIAVTVADNTTTQFSVKATDLAPHTSACSAPISYSEETDLVPPAAPQLTKTDPASPGTSGAPRILGAAESGSTVSVYAGPNCAGAPLVTGSAAEFGSPGIAVQVAEGTTAAFAATATDASDNTSPCSEPISYTHAKATPDPGAGNGGPPPILTPPPSPAPACVVPKLAGKTLARARAALTAAACKLGTVRKPKPRKGKRLPPLVVRSSTPAAGAKPAAGKVNVTLGPKPRKAHR